MIPTNQREHARLAAIEAARDATVAQMDRHERAVALAAFKCWRDGAPTRCICPDDSGTCPFCTHYYDAMKE